jgi:cytochrome c biogenesis protein CcmG/thiol:disulfide interchange protein DsbE
VTEPLVASHRRTARWVALAVGVALIAFVVVLATRPSADARGVSSALVGKPVPRVSGTTLSGETFDIDQYRGRWVVVNFFASWCVPCQVEHPELVEFTDRHRVDGRVQVVSVAFQDDPAVIRRFFAERGGDWPVVVGDTGPTALAFGVTGVPESYVVSPDGIVVAKFLGVTADQLDSVMGFGPAAGSVSEEGGG